MARAKTITDQQAIRYLFELVSECDVAIDCYKLFKRAASTWLQHDHPRDSGLYPGAEGLDAERAMKAAVEGLLSASGRVSLFLFPSASSGRFAAARGAKLCQLLGLAGEHPVSERTLRNDWMHFDQRIDREVMAGRDVPIGFYILSPHYTPSNPERMLRLLDPRTATIHILGEAHSLEDIAGTIHHVNEQAWLVLTPESPESDTDEDA